MACRSLNIQSEIILLCRLTAACMLGSCHEILAKSPEITGGGLHLQCEVNICSRFRAVTQVTIYRIHCLGWYIKNIQGDEGCRSLANTDIY